MLGPLGLRSPSLLFTRLIPLSGFFEAPPIPQKKGGRGSTTGAGRLHGHTLYIHMPLSFHVAGATFAAMPA